MNYLKVYNSIISNAKSENRVKLNKNDIKYVYYENHHILPKCLKGTNDKENLVLLTAREHFICHKLLTKIYSNHRGIILAFYRLTTDKKQRKISSKDYEYSKYLISSISHTTETKKKISESLKGKKHSLENRKKRSQNYKEKEINKGEKNPMFGVTPWIKGKKHSKETLEKMRKPKSEEAKKHMSISHLGNIPWMKGKTHSVETKKKIIEAGKGRKHTEETKLKFKNRIPWNKGLKLNSNKNIS